MVNTQVLIPITEYSHIQVFRCQHMLVNSTNSVLFLITNLRQLNKTNYNDFIIYLNGAKRGHYIHIIHSLL